MHPANGAGGNRVDLTSRLHDSEQAGAAVSDGDLVALVQSLPYGDARREQACESLVARYQGLLRPTVRHYRSSPEMTDELMQVGYLGLMKAINGFDPQVGTSLLAYARPCNGTACLGDLRSWSTQWTSIRCWPLGRAGRSVPARAHSAVLRQPHPGRDQQAARRLPDAGLPPSPPHAELPAGLPAAPYAGQHFRIPGRLGTSTRPPAARTVRGLPTGARGSRGSVITPGISLRNGDQRSEGAAGCEPDPAGRRALTGWSPTSRPATLSGRCPR
jgi:DNA-directed RNA polymerase specialized sigma24 family protein